jgi:hypothetical protein
MRSWVARIVQDLSEFKVAIQNPPMRTGVALIVAMMTGIFILTAHLSTLSPVCANTDSDPLHCCQNGYSCGDECRAKHPGSVSECFECVQQCCLGNSCGPDSYCSKCGERKCRRQGLVAPVPQPRVE